MSETCPNCNEQYIDSENPGDDPGYEQWDCPNCGRGWNDYEVYAWGSPVCKKCGEVLSGKEELAVNDEPSLGGCCA